MRVGRGRQAASFAATVGVVIHGAAAPLVDALKVARPADAPDGVVLVRSQTYTRRVSSALPAATSSDARHSVSAQAGSATKQAASVADNEWHVVTPRRDRRRAAGRRSPPPDRRRIIPPSPPNSGPARANAPGRPARAKPPVSRAGARARATAGPSVGGAANTSRGAPDPSARPAQATPAPAATAAPPVTTGAAIESSTARPTPDGSTAPRPTQTTEQRDVNGGTAAAFPRRGSSKRRCRRRNNRPSPDPPPQNSRPSPNLTDPLYPPNRSVHDKQWWDAFVAVVEDFISEIAETKPQRQAAGGRQDGPPAAAHRGQGRADAAANPPPPAPTRGRDAPAAVPDFAATTPPDVSEEVLPPITPSEVQQWLQKASNTAPGSVGVT
ncbi:translation initiation factor IF-2-like [Schistocerca piceifrons]|uniref:translation initiation factor IF-2-like n=1 Tax=Schistocerca piceifrons TaxID=274613 RepID=UPI001F5F8FB5|nr:translation initiation factor IF-2-like [Schistocerca piceifrons]